MTLNKLCKTNKPINMNNMDIFLSYIKKNFYYLFFIN